MNQKQSPTASRLTARGRLSRPSWLGRRSKASRHIRVHRPGRRCESRDGIKPGLPHPDNPAKTAETFRDGWLHTGDLGRIDADGFLYICGRVKDMIITGGQNVHAAEVEAVILAFPGVADCAVIGLPDELGGAAKKP